MTFNHTSARWVANGGFAQKVPLPSNPSSSQLASYHSSEHDTLTAIAFGTLAYTVVLPKNAVLTDVRVILTTLFTASAKIEIGHAAAGADILGQTAIDTASSRNLPLLATIPGSSADGQTLFVTITGAPAVGAGFLIVSYLNPATVLGSVND